MSGKVVSGEVVSEEVASGEVASEEEASGKEASRVVASEEVTWGEVTSEDLSQDLDVWWDLSLVFHLAMEMVLVFLSVQKFFLGYEMAVW